MKNSTNTHNTLKGFIKPAFFVLFFAGLLQAAPVQAAAEPKETPVEIKYLGSQEGTLLFQIHFTNPNAEAVNLVLRDEQGNVIYTEVVREKVYSRKIRFEEMDTDKLKLTLSLRTGKAVQSKTFEIKRSTRVIEDIAVVTL
jgi:hypothetical protein